MKVPPFAIVGMLSVVPASAATINHTYHFSGNGDLVFGAYSDVDVPAFNTALGTLLQVTLSVSARTEWTEPMINYGDSSEPVIALTVTDLYSYGTPADLNDLKTLGGVALSGPTYSIVEAHVTATLAGSAADNPADYANAQDFTFNLGGEVLQSDGWGAFDDAFGGYHGKLVVTYEYDRNAVPEPPSLAVFALGALGLVAFRRQR